MIRTYLAVVAVIYVWGCGLMAGIAGSPRQIEIARYHGICSTYDAAAVRSHQKERAERVAGDLCRSWGYRWSWEGTGR